MSLPQARRDCTHTLLLHKGPNSASNSWFLPNYELCRKKEDQHEFFDSISYNILQLRLNSKLFLLEFIPPSGSWICSPRFNLPYIVWGWLASPWWSPLWWILLNCWHSFIYAVITSSLKYTGFFFYLYAGEEGKKKELRHGKKLWACQTMPNWIELGDKGSESCYLFWISKCFPLLPVSIHSQSSSFSSEMPKSPKALLK